MSEDFVFDLFETSRFSRTVILASLLVVLCS